MISMIACTLSALAFLPYIRDTLTGVTQPERASWLIWSVLGTISFFSQVHEGALTSLWFTGTQVTITIVIFLLSVRLGHGQYLSQGNKRLYAIAAMGLLSWHISDSAIYALVIAIGISLLGAAKTVAKAYRYPNTETVSTWLIALLASVFGVASVGQSDAVLLAYPVYLVTVYTAISLAILTGRHASYRAITE